MKSNTDTLKKQFREGHHAQAIAACEALCLQDPANHEARRLCATMHALVRNYARSLELLLQVRNPAKEDPDVLFNIALCERELRNFAAAAGYFKVYTEKFPGHPDGWTSLAECSLQLNDFDEGVRLADRAIQIDPASLPAWTVRGNCQKSAGRSDDALASFNRAIQLAPQLAPLKVSRGDTLQNLGKLREAAADYQAALALVPTDDETLKKATLCLLESGQGDEALGLCRAILKTHPDMLTARLGEQWVLSQLVPLWHVPMMNEPERNQAFQDGIQAAVTPEKVVFEIGTGSGLLAMMAARLGAQKVFTCEAVGLVAGTARNIIQRNGYQDRITVIGKSSQQVELGKDLPVQADILVHEIFSSELLGEHVLPAIEDAKRRLLKPGGVVLPSAGSIMIALVGGDELGKNLHVDASFGFDLRDFNAIHPKKRPLYREDLAPVLMSDDIEAFRFDFSNEIAFPAQRKQIGITARKAGLCYGVIQWIRIELGEGARFENHPSRPRAVSNWQHTVYGFDEPVRFDEGAVVSVTAMHDRSRPWFQLA